MGIQNRRNAITAMLAGGLALGAGWGGMHAMAQGKAERRISGKVLYRERIMLPPQALVTVSLLDVSRADAPADVLAQTQIKGKSASPFDYELQFDPARIDPRHRYSLQARITVGDQLIFISTTSNPPDFEREAQEDILVTRVGATPGNLGGSWLAEDIEGGGVIDNLQTTLTIGTDGQVSGSTGCNRFSGKAEVEGRKLQIGALGVTSRMCVDAAMAQEQKFLAALAKVRGFQIDTEKDLLFLQDEAGSPVMRLIRHPD